MRRISILLVFLLVGIQAPLRAQWAETRLPNKWHLGLNFGASWQDSDVKSVAGLGFGLTFGKYFWLKEGRFFSWDWRFRYLRAVNYGQGLDRSYGLANNEVVNGTHPDSTLNYAANPGYILHNYRMGLHEYNLELSLGFNRLRERTGIILKFFGGIGFTQYRVKTDLIHDLGGGQYDFTKYDSVGNSYSDVSLHMGPMWGRDFETDADGNRGTQLKVMPSLGITLGYQFTKVFSMGFEHKVTYALNDNIDGYRWNNDNTPQGQNDLYHYSSLYMHFGLGGGSGTVTRPPDPKPDNIARVQRPVVNITSPTSCPATSPIPSTDIRATIYNIDYKSQITFKINGAVQSNFTFNKAAQQFVAMGVALLPGNNIIEIKAANSAGSDYKSCIINYATSAVVIPQNPVSPPVITVHNPATNPSTSAYNSIYITATILNVTNQNQVSFNVNGASQSNFYFNPSNGAFSAGITLNNGNNNVTINAVNSAGSDQESLVINYQPPVTLQPPVVTIFNPTVNPYTVSTNSGLVEATVLNVQNASDISLKINGMNSTAFSYNTATKKMQISATLNPGSNLFEITATNAAGSDYENTTIIYKEPVLNYPPLVTYTSPTTNPFNTTNASTVVHATVTNVQTQNQVNVKLNGTNIPNFSFNPSTGDVSFTANLQAGMNTVQVTGTNPYGSDSKTLTIIYNKQILNLPPYVTITYPATNPYNTNVQSESVVASVLNIAGASNITFKANGVVSTNFTYNTTSKIFTAQVSLHGGTNIFEIKAVNQYGQDSKTQTIIYSDPCYDPLITNISPLSNTFTSNTQQLAYSAQVAHITQASQLTLKNNGTPVAFQFDANTGMVSATINLSNGVNTLVLKGVNNCGQDQEDYTITYVKPVQPPVVTFIQPAVNPQSVTASAYNISASVLHVAGASNITFKHNGTVSTAFTYSTSTKLLSAALNLTQGNNLVEITGVNADGTDSKSTVIIYNPVPPPCNNPSVVITYPAAGTFATQSQILQLTATVLNSTQQQITLKLNGNAQPFTLNGSNLIATLNLQNGANTIHVAATNNCGTHSATVTVNYTKPVVPPVVTITQPGVNPFAAANANIQILAKIYHVTSQQNVTFKANGVVVPAFTFNPSTNDFSANYTLTQPSTVFEITGTNPDGTDSKSVTVTYVQANPVCNNPVITLIQPTTASSTTTIAAFTLSVKVTNVTGASDITIKHNGVVKTFNWTAVGSLATLVGNLDNGINNFEIKAANTCGTVSENVTVTYNKPLVPPIVTITTPQPSPHTTTATTQVINAGIQFVPLASGVTCKVNGSSFTGFTYNPSNGSFTATVNLVAGNNTVEIIGVNDDGMDDESVIIISNPVVVPPCVAPAVSISGPSGNNVTQQQNLTAQVSGTIVQSNITVQLNGSTVPFTYTNGTVTAALTLSPGPNNITVMATNACGSDSKSVTVTACSVPTVLISTPATGTTFNTATTSLSAVVAGVSQNQITVKNNGQTVAFTYDANTQTVTANVTLATGQNVIEVKAQNACGTDTKTTEVSYVVAAPNPPVVNITTPAANGTTVNAAAYTFQGTVLNVNSQNDITVTFNGQPTTNFTYNTTSHAISVPVTLVLGNNTLQVSATNAGGSDSDQKSIEYQLPCSAPTVNISVPVANATLAQASFNLSAAVSNVTQNQVTVKLNGTAVPFTLSNNVVTAQLTAASGANTVVVTVTNECGTQTDNASVTYTPCVVPSASISTPANNAALTQSTIALSASVTNATQNQVTVKLNGNNVPFNFNNGAITAQLTAATGANTVVVTVTNDCGTDVANITVNYNPCVTPTVSITAPSNNAALTSAAFTLSANVSNVTQNQVSVQLNGSSVPFTLTNNVVSASLTAVSGPNIVSVTVTNECGTANDQQTVTYTAAEPTITICHVPPGGGPSQTLTIPQSAWAAHQAHGDVMGPCPTCIPPTVNISAPSANATITQAGFNLTAAVANVTQNQVTVKLNGTNVPFTLSNNTVSASLTAVNGANTVVVTVTNECGTQTDQASVTYNEPEPMITICHYPPGNTGNPQTLTIPQSAWAAHQAHGDVMGPCPAIAPCTAPTVTVSAPANNASLTAAAFSVSAVVTNATQNQVTVKLNGSNVPFNFSNNTVSASLTAAAGANTVVITVTNECGTDNANVVVNYNPCIAPNVTMTAPANNATLTAAAFTVSAQATNATQNQITVKLNGVNVPFNFNNNVVSASLTAATGSNTVVITVTNECGNDMANAVVNYNPEPEPCGPRFNPGNSAWEFCLITPSGTYTRDNLASNNNFTYSGPASSAYFKPIAGGGNAIVNGSPYPVQNGNYYLFTGNLTVNVSTTHPGSMGHWTICISSNTAPVFGNGNNRPASPCESTNGNGNNGGGNNGGGNNGGGNNNNGGGNNNAPDPNFNVGGNGTVTTTTNVCATVTCIGEDVMYNNTEQAYVKMGITTNNGGSWYGFNNNNNLTGGEQVTFSVPTGGQVALKAYCYAATSNWNNTLTSNSGSQWVYVLKNGDNAPNIPPAQGQSPVAQYLSGVVVNGKISLPADDVIYLFELRHVGNVGVDYQDVIMRITFTEGTNCSGISLPSFSTSTGTGGGGNNNNGGNNNGGNNNNNNMITICHTPPGGGPSQTIQIPQSAWATHQAHGDTQGPCTKSQNTNTNTGGNNKNNGGNTNINNGGNQNNTGGGNKNNTGGGNKNQGGTTTGGDNKNNGGNRPNIIRPNNNTNTQPNNTQPNNTGKPDDKKEQPKTDGKKEQPKTEENKEQPKTEEKKEGDGKTQPDGGKKIPLRRPVTGGGGGG